MGSRSGRTSTVLGTKQWHVTYVFVWWGPVDKKKHAFYKFFISVGNNKRKDWMLWPRRGKKRMPTHLQRTLAMPQNSTGGRKEKPHNEMNFW